MSVIIIAEQSDKKIKKQSLETISYGVAISKQMNLDAIVVVMDETTENLSDLGNYGVKKVVHQKNATAIHLDSKVASAFLATVCIDHNANEIGRAHV